MNFELISDYQPTGDQPEAIAQLTEGILKGVPAQTLLGVTGSGKTFTIANVIKNINKPTLILSHNKTLAAQLYGEFKNFFPNNAVEYYVSYYDYYQPEAYLPSSDTYIEKDLQINEEIDKLRLAATSALLSGRKDVVVISSVSCIYGMGNPSDFYNNVIEIKKGKLLDRNVFLRRLVDSLYVRNDLELNRGNFRVKGDTVDIYLAYSDNLLRVMFWDDEIDSIEEVDPVSGIRLASFDEYKIYPANLFMTTKESQLQAIYQIEDDLAKEVAKFEEEGKHYEAKRLYERVTYDMEMIRELGHCSGIENYSRYFDGRVAGTRPYCLLDFFPDDFLIVIDESHVSVPQIRAIASMFLPSDSSLGYVQEFGVAADGVVEAPRIVSGSMVNNSYMRLAAVSELNMHYVSTHFMHPDDLLDEDRGAKEGWETYRKGLEDYLDWLEQSAPSIRMQTGTECAAAVQRFSGLTVSMATSADSWDLHLGNLIDQGWLMFRANNGTPGRVRGGSLTKLTGNLYLLKATSATVHIERKTGGEA